MRELILTMSVSLDGFVAGPQGEVEWMFGPDEAAKAWKIERVSDAGTFVMGSRSFEGMAAFWQTSTDAFASAMNRTPKVVFSKRGAAVLKSAAVTEGLEDAPANAGTEPARLQPGAKSWAEAYVAGGDLTSEIAELKSQDGKPIVALGGAAFARSLIARELVDQYALLVHPVALGKGLPIFSDAGRLQRLKLVGSIAFPGGSIALTYRPA